MRPRNTSRCAAEPVAWRGPLPFDSDVTDQKRDCGGQCEDARWFVERAISSKRAGWIQLNGSAK